jgi:myosin-1
LFQKLFLLEEVRDRRYNEFAVILQRAFRKFNAVKYYHKIKMEASSLLVNKKERRRLSINRKFYGDYIGLDQYPSLKSLIPKRELIEFAQKCTKYDRQFKRMMRDVLLTNRAVYIIGREETKSKKKKLITEVVKRKIEFAQINKIVLR